MTALPFSVSNKTVIEKGLHCSDIMQINEELMGLKFMTCNQSDCAVGGAVSQATGW